MGRATMFTRPPQARFVQNEILGQIYSSIFVENMKIVIKNEDILHMKKKIYISDHIV